MSFPLTDLSTANSLEEQIYRTALELQTRELKVEEENRPDNTQIVFDTEANTVDITVTLDTNLTVADGNAVISVVPYLP